MSDLLVGVELVPDGTKTGLGSAASTSSTPVSGSGFYTPEVDTSIPSVPVDSVEDPTTLPSGSTVTYTPKGDEVAIMGSSPVTVTVPVDSSGTPSFITDKSPAVDPATESLLWIDDVVDERSDRPFLYHPDFAGYVDKYPDLSAAYLASGSTAPKAIWGRSHWESYGGREGREFPTYKVFS